MSDRTAYENLANAIIVQACIDYRTALKAKDTRCIYEVERFFKSTWYEMLSTLDGRVILEKLKKEHYNANH